VSVLDICTFLSAAILTPALTHGLFKTDFGICWGVTKSLLTNGMFGIDATTFRVDEFLPRTPRVAPPSAFSVFPPSPRLRRDEAAPPVATAGLKDSIPSGLAERVSQRLEQRAILIPPKSLRNLALTYNAHNYSKLRQNARRRESVVNFYGCIPI
jgi:hypothetical protein